MKKIGLKYCGNCNPHIDSPAIINYLKKHSKGEWEFVSWTDPDYSLLLIMSGCPVDCATRPPFKGKVISVSGYLIDLAPVSPDTIQKVLIDRIRQNI